MATTTGPVHFLNVEYFFRLLYEAVASFQGGAPLDLLALLSQVWILVTIVSILVSLVLLAVFIHSFLRFHQVLDAEAAKYVTLHAAHAEEDRDHSRWAHIRTLIESPHESDWRQAIIEADIMLDDLLSQLGYPGDSVGEKLKAVNPERFQTIRNAWDAHMVRNAIAHQGTAYKLDEHHAHRTIALYETVMREHGEI